jgi:glycosyl transferase family 87
MEAILGRRDGSRARITLMLVLAALSLLRIASYRQYTEAPYRTANDFTPDYVSAQEWMAGSDPYAPLGGLYEKHFDTTGLSVEADQLNPHPPILIVLAAPLARLGVGGARAALLLVDLAAIFLAVLMVCGALSISRRTSVVVALGVLALPLVAYEVRWAQINGLILLALVWGWRSLRRGSERGAGIALGLAAAVKIYPWLMVVPLLRQLRLRAAAWMLGTAAAATAVGIVALGPAATVRFVTVASGRNVEAWGAAPHGISLVTLPFRAFASGRWLSPGAPVAAWIPLAGLLILALCVLGVTRTRASASGDMLWATVPWMVLASPIAWPHYLVTAIPLGILVLHRAGRLSRPARVIAFASIAVLGLGSPFSEWLPGLGYGAAALGSTVVIAAVGCLAVLEGRASNPALGRFARTAAPLSSGRVPLAASSSQGPLR